MHTLHALEAGRIADALERIAERLNGWDIGANESSLAVHLRGGQ